MSKLLQNISPTFYDQLFAPKGYKQLFSTFRFVLFRQEELWRKDDIEMLVILTIQYCLWFEPSNCDVIRGVTSSEVAVTSLSDDWTVPDRSIKTSTSSLVRFKFPYISGNKIEQLFQNKTLDTLTDLTHNITIKRYSYTSTIFRHRFLWIPNEISLRTSCEELLWLKNIKFW